MGRVFITQQPKPNKANWMPNLSPAMPYGHFIFVFGANEQPWTDPDGAMEKAQVALRDFDPDEDYVLWPNSGDPAACWIILLVLARFSINKIRMLYWERKMEDGVRSRTDGFYSPVTFNLPL
jgi:hypothetical protein